MDFNLESSTASMNVNLAQVFKQNNIEYIFEQPRHPSKIYSLGTTLIFSLEVSFFLPPVPCPFISD